MEKKIAPELVNAPFPEELADSLRVITGERPESFQKEFVPNTSIYPKFEGAAFGGESSQAEFLKKKDPVDKKIRFLDNQVKVFDLMDPKQELEYNVILDKIGDPESGVILAEPLKDPQILLDPNASCGYRAIVVVKTAKPQVYLKPRGEGYKVQEKKKRGKKTEVAE